MAFPTVDLDAVSAIMAEAAAQEIMPRWRNLQPHEVREKTRGDPVTDADVGTERVLTDRLTALLPGSTVVGEEGVADDPLMIERLEDEAPVWLIDPVDGTANFRDGSELFCCMVALIQSGETLAAWIYSPVTQDLAVAERGAGARFNGAPMTPNGAKAPAQMEGAVHVRYMPKAVGQTVSARLGAFASNKELYCAGHVYQRLATGELDHALFWRCKPWDHAMGALIVEEAGGRTAFQDETRYQATIQGRTGLISVAHAPLWTAVRDILLPPDKA